MHQIDCLVQISCGTECNFCENYLACSFNTTSVLALAFFNNYSFKLFTYILFCLKMILRETLNASGKCNVLRSLIMCQLRDTCDVQTRSLGPSAGVGNFFTKEPFCFILQHI